MDWRIEDIKKLLPQLTSLFEKYSAQAPEFPFYKMLSGFVGITSKNVSESGYRQAFKDILVIMVDYYERLADIPKEQFQLELEQLDVQLREYLIQKVRRNNKKRARVNKDPVGYWKNVEGLYYKLIFDLMPPSIGENLMQQIISKMMESINNENFMISRLIIEGPLDEDVMMNLLFFNVIGKEITYKNFVENPDKYGTMFFGSLNRGSFPILSYLLNGHEYHCLKQKIQCKEMLVLTVSEPVEGLIKRFPKTYRRYRLNPFIIDP